MTMVPREFASVDLGSFEPNGCSPEIDDDVRGLRIRAPDSIVTVDGVAFPVCGTFKVEAPVLNRFTSMSNEIVIIAVNARSHRPDTCNLLRKDHEPVREHFDETREGWESTITEGWFNIDLFDWMDDLPRQPGRYYVFATIGECTSNVCTVELVAP